MARFYKYSFSRDSKPLQRKLIFIGQHEPDVNTGLHEKVEIEIEGETTAFILGLSRSEARRICAYLDRMGYGPSATLEKEGATQ